MNENNEELAAFGLSSLAHISFSKAANLSTRIPKIQGIYYCGWAGLTGVHISIGRINNDKTADVFGFLEGRDASNYIWFGPVTIPEFLNEISFPVSSNNHKRWPSRVPLRGPACGTSWNNYPPNRPRISPIFMAYNRYRANLC